MQLARVQIALEHSTHASEALASAGQATRRTRVPEPHAHHAPRTPNAPLGPCPTYLVVLCRLAARDAERHQWLPGCSPRRPSSGAAHTRCPCSASLHNSACSSPSQGPLCRAPLWYAHAACMLPLASTVKDQCPRRPLPGLIASAVKYSAAVGRTYPAASPSPAYKMQRRALFPAAPPSRHSHRRSPLC